MIKKYSINELKKLSKDKLIEHILELYKIVDLVESLQQIVKSQDERIKQLEEKIKPMKTSSNSSIAPSTDLTRPKKKDYKKGKLGPKKGHKGHSRKISGKPDFILHIPLKECPRTGEEIKTKSKSFKRHQVIELTMPEIFVIEIQRQITTGPDGKTIIAPNPDGIKKHQRFGPNLKTQVAFMRFRQNVPWGRILEWFKEVVKDKIAVGTLQSIFHELKEAVEAEYNEIKDDVKSASVVGCDETGVHLNGDKWWLHVFRTTTETLYTFSKNRDHNVPQRILGEDFNGIICSDFYGAYNAKFFTYAKGFQKCIGAHAIRDLQYAVECEKGKGNYAKELLNLVLDAIILKKYYIFATDEYKIAHAELEQRMDYLLKDDIDTFTREGKKLWKRFRRYRDSLFTFLYIENVEPDNNGSERDIQELVSARKVSRAFRTVAGLEDLTKIKSIIQTSRKRNENYVEKFLNAYGRFSFEYG